jgi:subtilisin-like proprotein convertase family protein
VDTKHFTWTRPKTTVAIRRPRGIARRIALGALAATLIATTAIPAFATKPDHQRHGGHHANKQEQDASAAGKRQSNKRKTVKKSFTNGASIAIPAIGAADLYPSPIVVSGLKKGRITDVNLTLRGLSHSFPADIDLLLVAPSGRNVVVMDEVGRDAAEDSVTDIILTLDDEAARVLPSDSALTSGSFRPVIDDPDFLDFPVPAPTPSEKSALFTFDGSNPNGEWRLFVIDDGATDEGAIADGWELEITAKSKAKNRSKKKR